MAPDQIEPQAGESHVVGGVRLARPFRVRRLGHFGLDIENAGGARHFYEELLGFRVADTIDMVGWLPPELKGTLGSTIGYFCRHGSDHHSFVWFPRRSRKEAVPDLKPFPEVTINQITWQVGSLREVVEGLAWLRKRGVRIRRTGRENPGSNWHLYSFDPEGHINEIFYGIEQIGWDGFSKPWPYHGVEQPGWAGFHRSRSAHQFVSNEVQLPQRSEYAEVSAGLKEGIDPRDGSRATEAFAEVHDVGGVLLARPFKIVRIGPVRLFVKDLEVELRFYRDVLGLVVTEELNWHGHRCVFLRCNTEHHTLALYPVALRAELGLRPNSTLMSFGVQVGDYQQLRDAVTFLKEKGVTIKMLPPELFPGIDYCAFALDPDGHPIQLYYYMEQIGWDGRPRPAALRPKIDPDNWPETVTAASDTFEGEVFLGPLG